MLEKEREADQRSVTMMTTRGENMSSLLLTMRYCSRERRKSRQ